MCEVCNGKSIRQIVARTKLDVARHGWSVMTVEGVMTAPSFGYTIGLTEQRHLEFLVTGRDNSDTYNMLSELMCMRYGVASDVSDSLVLPLSL